MLKSKCSQCQRCKVNNVGMVGLSLDLSIRGEGSSSWYPGVMSEVSYILKMLDSGTKWLKDCCAKRCNTYRSQETCETSWTSFRIQQLHKLNGEARKGVHTLLEISGWKNRGCILSHSVNINREYFKNFRLHCKVNSVVQQHLDVWLCKKSNPFTSDVVQEASDQGLKSNTSLHFHNDICFSTIACTTVYMWLKSAAESVQDWSVGDFCISLLSLSMWAMGRSTCGL